jgi:uncharacterized protein involved in exopolysaccharide biosynthesis
VRAAADRAPDVEAEYAQLNLEVEFARKTYDQLVAKGESAALGLKAEESSRSSGFRVIEPARAGGTPAFPGRLELGWAAVLLSLMAAVAVPLGVERVRPTVEDAAALQRLVQRPVIGEIRTWPSRDAMAGLGTWAVVAAAGGLLALQAVALTWLQRTGGGFGA